MTKEETSKIVRMLFASADRTPTTDTFMAWHDAIKHLDYSVVEQAAKKFRFNVENRYAVTVGAFLSSIVDESVPTYQECFAEIRMALNVGRYYADEVKWSHPVVELTVGGRSGFLSLCDSEVGTIEWSLPKRYESSRSRYVQDAAFQLATNGRLELEAPERPAIASTNQTVARLAEAFTL
jgi:hypothetical protein